MDISVYDNGGRRSGNERRLFSYLINVPERRSGKDRRSGSDRRTWKRIKIDSENERRRFDAAGLIR